MSTHDRFSRRWFMALAGAAPLALKAAGSKHIPVGLELYSVRNELKKDVPGTVRGVAKMGYECVEFYAPYYDWTPEYAKEIRKEMDDLGIHCYSTHNSAKAFSTEGIGKAIELNQILGSRFIVMAHPGNVKGIDGWKQVAATLNQANDTMKSHGIHAGYHNHGLEWKPVEGQKPLELLASSTDKSIMMQFDVGTCVEAGSDPVAWINSNPGRIRSVHLKDWGPEKGYQVLFGEGAAPWAKIFAAAEAAGGVEYYLIEQEGSAFPEMETAERCLATFRKMRA